MGQSLNEVEEGKENPRSPVVISDKEEKDIEIKLLKPKKKSSPNMTLEDFGEPK